MDVAITPLSLVTVCALVFLAAMVDAIGGGGGLISLPAYLLTGLPPVNAAACNKFSASFGTLVATIRYFKEGKVLLKPALWAVLGALPGAYAGAQALELASPEFVRAFMLAAIPAVALVVVFKRDTPETTRPITRARLAICFVIGLAVGFYDGFFGPGTGTILIMLFTWLIGMEMVTASGTAKAVNLASNMSAMASMLIGGHVVFGLAVPAMVCSVLGGWLGAKLALRRGAKLVRYVMLGVLALLIAKLAWEWFV